MSIRIAVTGLKGQVVTALCEAAGPEVTVFPVGRPELDLSAPESVFPALGALAPDLIVNAAAYTAVDLAEKEKHKAAEVNWIGAEAVAKAARRLNRPLIYLSTDYVFNGEKEGAYTEEDPVSPINAYGASKLLGEMAVADRCENYVILRTSWLYAPYGKNFVRTMLKLAEEKEEVRIVADAVGCPTYAPDLAGAIITIARALLNFPSEPRLRGIFHYAGGGETSWAGLAEEIFRFLAAEGRKRPRVIPVNSADYPTPAKRPINSRLDLSKTAFTFGLFPPHWRDSLALALTRLNEVALVNY